MSLTGEARNRGNYDPVRYKDWRYSKLPRNPIEEKPDGRQGHILDRNLTASQIKNISKRPLWPKRICYVQPDETSYLVQEVDEKIAASLEYVFISYSGTQFNTRHGTQNTKSVHRQRLMNLAIRAARDNDVWAFWIDVECVTDEAAGSYRSQLRQDPSVSSTTALADVYRMPDIVRASAKLCIVLCEPTATPSLTDGIIEPWKEWLVEWGDRMWCLPEILSAATEKTVDVYATVQSAHRTPFARVWSGKKRKLIELACRDAQDVREILNHQEGQASLSPLEVMKIAMKIIAWRKRTQFTPGDQAYVLKALVRRHPEYVQGESGFEAFASISLANDSANLLERLICLLPQDPFHNWMNWTDQFLCEPWDINPLTQVAAIVDSHSVLLDGAMGASIQWNQLERVHFTKRPNAFRYILEALVRIVPFWFLFAVFLLGINPHPTIGGVSENFGTKQVHIEGTTSLGFVFAMLFFMITLAIIFTLPMTLLSLYRGKIWEAQALLIGIEGVPENLKDIENRIFGSRQGLLSWSTNGSIYSRHTVDEFHDRVALKPNLNAKIPREEDTEHDRAVSTIPEDEINEKENSPKHQRFFTVIDTHSREATVFKAFHPPTTAFVCGQENGMQRVVLCSYEWKTRTYYRESVIRMKTLVKDKMSTIDRFRFALQRPNKKAPLAMRPPPNSIPVTAQPSRSRGPPIPNSTATGVNTLSSSAAGYFPAGSSLAGSRNAVSSAARNASINGHSSPTMSQGITSPTSHLRPEAPNSYGTANPPASNPVNLASPTSYALQNKSGLNRQTNSYGRPRQPTPADYQSTSHQQSRPRSPVYQVPYSRQGQQSSYNASIYESQATKPIAHPNTLSTSQVNTRRYDHHIN